MWLMNITLFYNEAIVSESRELFLLVKLHNYGLEQLRHLIANIFIPKQLYTLDNFLDPLRSCWCIINSVVMRLISCRCRSTEIKGIKVVEWAEKSTFSLFAQTCIVTCHLHTRRHK